MIEISFIIGLPGSGKSHFARTNFNCKIIDDITSIDQLPEAAEDMVIIDVNFCDENVIEKAIDMIEEKYKNTETFLFKKYYFENNPDASRENVAYRNDGRNVEGTIKRFEKTYDPPKTAMKVWRQ